MASIQHLVKAHAFTTAESIATRGKVIKLPDNCRGLTAECIFVDGGGGTNIKVYIQTALDMMGSTTVGREPQVWFDIMCFAFATTAGRKLLKVREETTHLVDYVETADALGDDTAISGLIGSHVRARIVTTGTYTATSTIDVYLRIEE